MVTFSAELSVRSVFKVYSLIWIKHFLPFILEYRDPPKWMDIQSYTV